jgi:DNA-binding XRE family transcriptional regulator
MLKAWRYREEMSIREAAERIGIPWSTYGRIEKGYPMSGDTFAVILRWLLED